MKKIGSIVVFLSLTMLLSFSAFAAKAGNWIQAADGRWWYQYAEGPYPRNGWEVIDGKYYYFDAEGWLLQGSWTPDYYWVDSSGAWDPSMGRISPVEYEIWAYGEGDAPDGSYGQQ